MTRDEWECDERRYKVTNQSNNEATKGLVREAKSDGRGNSRLNDGPNIYIPLP